tara:strand:+ start:6139 stop:7614 length:1476 start_codon:yes stop_codon:yes gene_type:complete
MDILFVVRDVDSHSPISLMQLSAMAKQRGDQTHLGVLSKEDVLGKVKKLKPRVVAYTGCTGEHKYYAEINHKIKKEFPGITTIMGGPHATFFPEGTLEDVGLDAVCIGEGDYVFPEFLERVENNEKIEGLENIITPEMAKKGKRPELKSLIQNLDDLPFPDRDLFFENTENGESPLKNFMVARGCPYDCSYCFNKSFRSLYAGEKYLRRHSVDYVIKEISEIKEKWPMKFIKLYDDILTYKADDWLKEFSQKYKDEIGLPFYCLTRADLMVNNPNIATLLKDAGCHTIQMAAESTNDRIRNDLLNRNMTKEQIKEGFKICLDQGMTIVTNYILGLPTSTIQDDLDAVDFNIESGAQICEFPIFQPYPGTPLGDMCVKEGWFDGDFNKLHTSYNNRSPLSCFTEEEKDIQANINRLGQIASTIAPLYPSMKNLIMDYMVQGPADDFFASIYSQHKWEVYSSLVYPMEQSEASRNRAQHKTLKLETFRRTNEE